tara:strand:- start:78 stop:554 length:477 start_codon:yes stop_codon:yes gene_type:complete
MDLANQITNILTDELSNISDKSTGIVYLEKLKYTLIEKIETNIKNKNFNEFENINQTKIEINKRKINFKLIISSSPKIYLNTKIKANLLVICLKESLGVNIQNQNNKKNFTFNCIPFTGIVLPIDTKCSLNLNKKSVILEIYYEDDFLDIENTKKNII